MTAITELAGRVREINRSNGWNPVEREDWGADRHRVPSLLALIHSELSEAHDELCADELDESAFTTELADVEIRVLDVLGGFTGDIEGHVAGLGDVFVHADVNRAFVEMHKLVTAALEAFRNSAEPCEEFKSALAKLYFYNRAFASTWSLDLDSAVSAKLTKNAKRGYRHGGKRV